MIKSESLKLKVIGDHQMDCSSCERSITFSLSQMSGVEHVKANWKNQEIQIKFSSKIINLEKIEAELNWIGYQVEVV